MNILQHLKLNIMKYLPDGILNFLLITGMFCGFLSAFGITYHGWIIFPALFVLSVACACIYHCNSLQRIVFYFILIFIFFAIIIRYGIYVNSGFYVIINRIVDEFSMFLNISTYQEYQIFVSDHKQAVTFVILCFSFLFLPLINIFAAEKKNIIGTFLVTIPLLCVPIYIHAEPAVHWQATLICGYILIFFEKYMKKTKRNGSLRKLFLLKLSFFGITYMIILFFLIIFHLVFPQNYYDETYEENTYKEAGYDSLSTFLIFGFSGFFNDYQAVGGMSGGKLGGVNSVRPDYETDLIVEFAPFSNETLYLKGFTGVTYTGHQWISEHDSEYSLWENESAYYTLKSAYKTKEPYASKALLRLRNIGASYQYEYVPYYTEYSTFDPSIYQEEYCEYTFFPYHDVENEDYYEEPEDAYLEIPEKNMSTLAKIVKKAGLEGSTEEIVDAMTEYFAAEYTYTLSPGKTPSKEDYVNYFLTDSKKGYCSHFASAAVLLLRYCDIPARYVEGYALHAYDMADGTLQNNLEYKDFYTGYNSLGETGVIRCEINDSQAHAWVEYWDEDFGWRVAEFTPPSDGAEEYSDFWDRFSNMMNGAVFDNTVASSAVQNSGQLLNNPALQENISTGLQILRTAVMLVVVLLVLYRLFRFQQCYYSSDKRGNLLRLYGDIYHIADKKLPQFRQYYSHKEQLDAIYHFLGTADSATQDLGNSTNLADVLEQLSFADKSWQELIAPQEYQKLRRALFSLKRKLQFRKRKNAGD